MIRKTVYRILVICFGLVWLINGLFCKVLDMVPRHREIVARILGEEYATFLTQAIGAGEVFMCIWIVTRIWSRLSAIAQIVLVVTMNIIEFILAPDLLLYGKFNIIVALFYVSVVAYHEFLLKKQVTLSA